LCYAPAAALVAIGLAAAPPVAAQSLTEELSALIADHPRLRAQRDTVAAAREDVRKAFAGFLPKAAISGDIGPEYVDSPQRRQIFGEASRMVRKSLTLTVTQNLFDGGRSRAEHKSALARREVSELTLEGIRQSLLLEGVTAYLNMMRRMRMVALAVQNEKTITRQLELEDERVRRGSGIALDVLFAKTRLQLAKERRVQLEGAREEARAVYAQVFGHPPTPARMVDPVVDLSPLPKDLEAAAATTLARNPTLRASDRLIDVARRQEGVARADLSPRLDAVGSAGVEENFDSVRGDRYEWSLLLRLTWEFFSGQASQAGLASATFRKSAAMNTYRFNRRKTVESLRIAWEQLSTARQRVSLLENAVNIAEEVFAARRRLRDAGRETAINVLDAQSEVFNARINLTAAVTDSKIALYRVLFAMGLLTTDNLGL
jgi:outer membrane protein, adhesin transport system